MTGKNMKLNRFYLSDKTVAEINSIVDELESMSLLNYEPLRNAKGSYALNAEIVTDGDGTIYDYRVFDPYHRLEGDPYRNFDGWSHWQLSYEDNNGYDIAEILEDFVGETQDEISKV